MKKILQHLHQDWYKYVLEILVLIIGIYGAFALESWNEERKEKALEKKIIAQLIEEYEMNLQQLNEKIAFRRFIVENALKIYQYYDDPSATNEDSLIFAISNLVHDPTFDPIDNDLLNGDNLTIIQDDEIRQRLSNWSSDLAALQEMEDAWQKLVEERLNPYLLEVGLVRDVVSIVFDNEELLEIWLLDKSLKDAFNASSSNRSLSKEDILKDKKIEGFAAMAIASNQLSNFQSFALRDKMKITLELLKEELK